jgi:Bacterial regulatory proteins, luxR family
VGKGPIGVPPTCPAWLLALSTSGCPGATTFDLDDYVFGALEAGASGFLLKDAPPEAIVHAVRQVAAGQGTIDQTLTRRILQKFVHRRRLQPVTARRAEALLTPREHEILLLLAQGMSNDDIARTPPGPSGRSWRAGVPRPARPRDQDLGPADRGRATPSSARPHRGAWSP